jgi:hypothetical protein
MDKPTKKQDTVEAANKAKAPEKPATKKKKKTTTHYFTKPIRPGGGGFRAIVKK